MFDIQLIGIKFVKPKQFGDFSWMCCQEEYSEALFIFNDNEEYHHSCVGGAGNAVMRKYNKYSKLKIPISAGIPTGTLEFGGYQSLDKHTKIQIDNSIDEIIQLVNSYKYKKIYYSSELDGKLGTSIFDVDDKVVRYITHRLFSLTNNPVHIIKILSNNYFNDDYEIDNCDKNSNQNTDFDIIKENLQR